MTWKHGRSFWAWVRLRDGSRLRRSLQTTDRGIAREMEHMLESLRGRREWQLIEAAAFGPSSIGELFDFWRRGDEGLAELRARLGDVDLNEYVSQWEAWALRRASRRSVDAYKKQLRVLMPEGKRFLRSTFTRRRISEALASLTCSGSTARRYLAAWSSFASYLVDMEMLDANPIRSVRAPRNNPPREVWLPLDEVMRLVDAQPEPFRALAALREGAGVEISAALRVRKRDVDLRRALVQVSGTKNQWRSRPVLVEDWALKRIAEYMTTKRLSAPDALLFDGVSTRRAWGVQKDALEALKMDKSYRLHDSRHSYAVRKMQEGCEPQVIANNLGHKDTQMLWKVYGKYRPTVHDLMRERMRVVP